MCVCICVCMCMCEHLSIYTVGLGEVDVDMVEELLQSQLEQHPTVRETPAHLVAQCLLSCQSLASLGHCIVRLP